jgi:hypothetical protein
MGLLQIPLHMQEIMASPTLQGANEAFYHIKITAPVDKPKIIYIQPNGSAPDIISFKDFAEIVRKHKDPFSQRFATSLLEWAEIQAGERARIHI